jgi:hypothetical protein
MNIQMNEVHSIDIHDNGWVGVWEEVVNTQASGWVGGWIGKWLGDRSVGR